MAKCRRDSGVGAGRWDNVMEEKFIELWQQYSCLYDVSSRDYHDRIKKEKCWRIIADALQQTVGEVQTKAASLQTQYGKLLRPKPSGSEDREFTSRQKWIINNLQFLQPFVVHRLSQSTLTLNDSEHITTDEGGEELELEEDASSSSSNFQQTSSPINSSCPEASSHHHNNLERAQCSRAKRKVKEKSTDELEIEKVSILRNVSETLLENIQDVDQTFAKQVATEMKLIRDPVTKMRLRRNILMMLYDAHENEVRVPHSDPQRALWHQTPWQGDTQQNQPFHSTAFHAPPAPPPANYLRAVDEAYIQDRDVV